MIKSREMEVFQIYRNAMELEGLERDAYIRDACEGNLELKEEVDKCLESASDPHFFTDALLQSKNDWFTAQRNRLNLKPGQFIGKFQIIKHLGEGGAADVFLVRQEEPQRDVALKLLKGGGSRVFDRFEIEQRVLARLDHPYVANIFESGVTEHGLPFFVMEFISGQTITEYCRSKALGVKDRLSLFVNVCEGVQYAHRKGVIHRDLKPSNILVKERDGRPVPKIIDFGISRALESQDPLNAHGPSLTMGLNLTGSYTIIGSLGYMSPEQTRLTGQDMDTRTDVYALGALLFELLTGVLPFDFQEVALESLDQVFQMICHTTPQKPSMRLQRLNSSAADIKTLKGDLDLIVLKALEKNKDFRYNSPLELADDLNRYLNQKPILARAPSLSYRIRRLIQRHRAGAIAVFFITMTLILGIFMASVGFLQARKSEKAALHDAANAASTLKLLEQFLTSPDPAAQGRNLRVEDLLISFSSQLESPGIDPEIKATLHHLFSKTLLNLGSYKKAYQHAISSVQLRTSLFGAEHPSTLDASTVLISCLAEMDDLPGAEKLCRDLLILCEARDDQRRKGTLLNLLSNILRERGGYEKAILISRQSIALHQSSFGQADPGLHTAMNHLANALYMLGQYEETEQLRLEVLKWRQSLYGERHPDSLTAMGNYSYALSAQRKFDEAEAVSRQALSLSTEVYGNHPKTALAMEQLGMILYYTKRFTEAEPLLEQSNGDLLTHYGPKHRSSLISTNNLSMLLMEIGEYQRAGSYYRDILAQIDPSLPDHQELMVSSMHNLAYVLLQQGHIEAAENEERKAMEASIHAFGETHPKTLTYMDYLAKLLVISGWLEEAEELYDETLILHRCRFGDAHTWTLQTRDAYLQVLQQLGMNEKAESVLGSWNDLPNQEKNL